MFLSHGPFSFERFAILLIRNNSAQYRRIAESHLIAREPVPSFGNVVIFGEMRVGKSSLVNMLAGEEVAPTSDGVVGCTSENHGYALSLQDLHLNVFDTAGLNEPEKGRVGAQKAIQNLFQLIRDVGTSGGLGLLVFVINSSLSAKTIENYDLLRDVFGNGHVRTAVVATKTEFVVDKRSWWIATEKEFFKYGMKFDDRVMVTATKGSPVIPLERQYMESKPMLQDLIYSQCRGRQPWIFNTQERFTYAAIILFKKFQTTFGITKDKFVKEVKQMLIGIEGKAEAERIAIDVAKGL